jgi:hypothetical protein
VQLRKTDQMPVWLTKTLLVGLGAVLLLLPFHAFLSTWGGTSIGPLWLWKSWKELLLAGLFVVVAGWLLSKPNLIRQLFRQRLVQVLSLYVVFSIVLAALHVRDNGADATSAGLAMNLRYLLAGVLAYLLATYGDVQRQWIVRGAKYIVAVAVVVASFGILQALVLPADFLGRFGYDKATTIAPASLIDNNPELLRAFGTLRGPNDFGAFLILPIVLLTAFYRKYSAFITAPAIAVLVWALVLSSSRSAWLGAIAALLAYAALTLGKKLSVRQAGVVVISLCFSGLLALYAAVNVPAVRMAVFHSSPGDSSLTEGSTDKHIQATVGGVERVIDDPLGCGIGCAGPASYYGDQPRISENYAVQLAEEVGIFGAVLFLVLVLIVIRRLLLARHFQVLSRSLLAALAGYVVIGMLLHVWADDPLSMTWWLLVGAVMGYNERNSWKKSKDSLRLKT